MRELDDRIAVVTGAASGIGRATAMALANRGCHLALVDVDAEALRATASACATPDRANSTHVVDVADRAQMQRLVHEVLDTHGGVDILVNNAGVSVQGSFAEQSFEDIEWILGVNLWGVIHGCKLFLPHLLAADEAHIVNLSSVFGIIGIPNNSTYCLTKYAVRGLTEALWEELRDTNVGITSVHPGGINTKIAVNSRAYDEAIKRRAVRMFEKMTSPEVAAEAIVKAIGEKAHRLLITREAYVIDGLKRLFPQWGNHWLANSARRLVER